MALAGLGALAYLALSAVRGSTGFALDDAWIHQVYARNLGTRGEFAFVPGVPSAGSTSPLWTLALALGYLLRLDFQVWTYLLGALLLGASAIIAGRLAERLAGTTGLGTSRLTQRAALATYISLFLLFEWHLAWSAVSGMEILLLVFFSLLVVERLVAGSGPGVLGLVAGALTLTRPEGIVLAGLIGLGMLWNTATSGAAGTPALRRVIRTALFYGLGLTVLILPYLYFNLVVSGTLLPNTFYAKNAEYADLLAHTAFPLLWATLFAVPWVGAQILLLPGFVFVTVALAARRKWVALIPVAWTFLLPALYAVRLPVAYQHGRYEMPVVPFIILYGVWGTAELFTRVRIRVVRTTWALSVAALVPVFWFVGANAYATDVSIVDCEMVQTARWVASNASAGEVVAAHDIGALGYFYERPVIDLAGLVTPDVIPFMRDEGRLREFLLSRHATLAIFFPDWYPTLAADPAFAPVRTQNCPAAREAGGTDMVIYRVSP